MSTIFLSYGRGDDEPFVRRLYDELTNSGFNVWFDRVSMPSRRLTFHQEIRDAVAACERFVLIVGPHATTSDYVRQEWQFAWFDAETVVTPILRVGEYSLVPDELKLLHCEDFREDSQYYTHFKELERILSDPPPNLGKLIGVPSLPANFLSRTDRLIVLRDAVRSGLDSPASFGGVVTYHKIHGIIGSTRHVGMHGMGGIGKSFLANLLVHDRQVREAFPDGIIWVGLGASPEIRKRMVEIHQALDGDGAIENETEGKQKLLDLLRDKAVLLVLDDAWHRSDVDAFDVLGPRCRALVTTRDAGLIDSIKGMPHPVELLSDEEALNLLAVSSGLERSALPAEALEVLVQCGRLPLAVALAGSRVRAGIPWSDLRDALREHELEFIEDMQAANPQHINLWRMIEVSVATLADDVQHRLAELAVFPADEQIPDAAIATLWHGTCGLSPRQSRKLLVDLKQLSLVQIAPSADIHADSVGKCSLHDLIHDFCIRLARRQLGTENLLHSYLLSAYQRHAADGWWSVPNDGYFLDHLRIHLIAAGRAGELADLMQHLPWLEAKAGAGLVFDLAADLAVAAGAVPALSFDRKVLELLSAALRTDVQFIARHPTTLFQCLWNRCWWYDSPQTGRHYEAPTDGWPSPGAPWEVGDIGLYRLMEQWREEKAKRNPECLWLCSLRPPDIHLASRQRAVIYTETGNHLSGRSVRFSSDSLRVGDGRDWWSVDTGVKFPEPPRQPSSREGEPRVFSPDGQIVVVLGGNSAFHTLDADGNILATTPPLNFVRPPLSPRLSYLAQDRSFQKAVPPDTPTILAEAKVIFSSDGLAFAAHGQVNWSSWEHGYGYWGVWETRTGAVIVPLEQFEFPVQDVVFSPNSQYVALAAGDPGDGLVDLEQGLFALWDLAGRAVIVQHGPGEYAYTTGIAFSPKSDRVFAWGGVGDGDFDYGAARGYIGVWETAIGQQLCLQSGSDRSIQCFILSPDGTRFAVGLFDGRIGLGDYVTLAVQLLTGHLGAVESIAFAPTGTLLASLGEDGTIRLLDLSTAGFDPGRLHNQADPLIRALFSYDGARAVTKCNHDSVWIWDTRTGEVVAKPRPNGIIIFIGSHPPFFFDGRSLVLNGSKGLCVMDVVGGDVIWEAADDDWAHYRYDTVALGHRRNVLAGARTSRGSFHHGEIVYLDGSRPTVQFDLSVYSEGRVALAFSADDRWLAAQHSSSGLTVYETATGSRRFSLPDPGTFLFSADGRFILAAGVEPLRLWEVESGTEAARQPVLACSACEAVSSDGQLRSTVPVRGAAFSPDGRRVVFITGDGVTCIWDVELGECSILARSPVPIGAIAAGHRYYAVADQQETAIVDTATDQEVAWFPVPFDMTAANFASHPHGRMWGGGNENRFYLFSLEGPEA